MQHFARIQFELRCTFHAFVVDVSKRISSNSSTESMKTGPLEHIADEKGATAVLQRRQLHRCNSNIDRLMRCKQSNTVTEEQRQQL